MYNIPKNDSKYEWTMHVVAKMHHYRIAPSMVKRIIRNPHRKEEGIAPGTVAVMQRARSKHPQEYWVMYKVINIKNQKSKIKNLESKVQELRLGKKRIISAWRYPGESPVGKKIPIPDEILLELEEENLI